MPITDILTHIEVASPASASTESQPIGRGNRIRRSDKGYRNALSRSLNEAEKNGKTAADELGAARSQSGSPPSHSAKNTSEPRPTPLAQTANRPQPKSVGQPEPESADPQTLGTEEFINVAGGGVQVANAIPPGLLSDALLFTPQSDPSFPTNELREGGSGGFRWDPPAGFRLEVFETEGLLPAATNADAAEQGLVPPGSLFAGIAQQISEQPAAFTQDPAAGAQLSSASVNLPSQRTRGEVERKLRAQLSSASVNLPSSVEVVAGAAPAVEPSTVAAVQVAQVAPDAESAQAGNPAPGPGKRATAPRAVLTSGGSNAQSDDAETIFATSNEPSSRSRQATTLVAAAGRKDSSAQAVAAQPSSHSTAVEWASANSPEGSAHDTGTALVEAGGETATQRPHSTEPAFRPTADPEARAVDLTEKVAEAIRAAHQQNRPLRVRLHPPELGTLQIEISSRGGSLTARLQVETAAAHQALVESLPLLRDALAAHGTVLDRIDVQLSPPQELRQPEFAKFSEGEPSRGSQRERGQRDADGQPQQDQSKRHSDQEPTADELDIEI